MKHSNMKAADDAIVSDPEAAMRRMKQIASAILSLPKSESHSIAAHQKRRQKKK
jgi:hypothetical protein